MTTPPTFASDFRRLMEIWDTVTARIKAEYPEYTPEEVDAAVRTVFNLFFLRKT